jgi:hypothetical protein
MDDGWSVEDDDAFDPSSVDLTMRVRPALAASA